MPFVKRVAARALQYHRAKHYREAIEWYDKALEITPGHPLLVGNRAENYIMVGRFDEAVRDYQIVIGQTPNDEAVWVNYGLALQCSGNYEAAVVAYDHAIKISDSNPFAYFNKGICLERDLGRTGDGVPLFKKALELDPNFHNATGGLSFNHLITGDFIRGWKDFEYRNKNMLTRFPGLEWDGRQTDDTLILVAEQGIGDILQFSRYAKIAVENGQPTAIYSAPEFHPLLSSLDSRIALLSRPEEVVEPYQWLPLMSMPRMLQTQVETIPAYPRYLSSSLDRIKKWGTILKPFDRNFKIGVCWHPGHPANPHVAARVIALREFAGIASIPGVQLFSLQKEAAAQEISEVPFSIIDCDGDPVPKKDLMMDAAAIIENLDLVISTDSSPLHLAGAVGCKTFAMIPKGGCWRWLLDRTDTPWYPSVTLYRQKEIHTWPEVLGRIEAAIRVLAEAKSFGNWDQRAM
jgi:hypothetical protein